jgi:hypothetical protein
LHEPVAALQSAAEEHAAPLATQPVRVALQICGCAPEQRVSPVAQAKQLAVVGLHRSARMQAVPVA